jgi:hypothetical protein
VLKTLFNTLLGGWAAQRIICVGDYATSPPAELTDVTGPLYNLDYDEIDSLTSFARDLLDSLKSYGEDQQERLQAEYSRLQEENFPVGQQHVLLNLTSHEYVLDKSYESHRRIGLGGHGAQNRMVWGLGDAALSRICWSQDPSTSMKHSGPITQGVWAGHRFAIIRTSVFKKNWNWREDWKDVSDEVNEFLARVWASEGIIKREARPRPLQDLRKHQHTKPRYIPRYQSRISHKRTSCTDGGKYGPLKRKIKAAKAVDVGQVCCTQRQVLVM